MCARGQVFDKNVPEEVAPICVRIENDKLNRLWAVCTVIEQQLDPLRSPTEDREIDPLGCPGCPGRESRTGPYGMCFQDAIVCGPIATVAELITFFVRAKIP